MQPKTPSTLDIIYENWKRYNNMLRDCIVPLTDEQLLLAPAAGMWSVGQLVQHLIFSRANWFNRVLQENDPLMNDYMEWDTWEPSTEGTDTLVRGLDDTWGFIETRLHRWTSDDCAVTFPNDWSAGGYPTPRSWAIYHVMEHDLHHGGEISLILGMHGLRGIDL